MRPHVEAAAGLLLMESEAVGDEEQAREEVLVVVGTRSCC